MNLKKSKDFPVKDFQEKKDSVMENIKKCSESVRNLQKHEGYYYWKWSKAFYDAVNKGKGRYKDLTRDQRRVILVKIELDTFGHSPTADAWTKEIREQYKAWFPNGTKIPSEDKE